MTELLDLYNSNKDFKEYMDRFIHNNPEYSLTEALNHKIVKDIAEYYIELDKKGGTNG